MSIPSHKLDSLGKQKVFGASALKYIKDRNDSLLITILVWNNLVNVYTAALATKLSIDFAKTTTMMDEATAIGIATGIVTFLLLLFWEITPKSFATKNAEKVALSVAPLYKFLMLILTPFNFVIEKIIKLITWAQKINKISWEEIEAFLDLGKESGTLGKHAHDKIKNILDFGATTAEEVMTPRVNMEMLSSKTTVKDSISFFLSHTHSRIPIYWKTIDKVKYFVTIRELLREKELGNEEVLLKDIEFRKILKVPLNQPISSILDTFRNARKHVAIVVDEYGWVAGLLTIEDILEEIVGEIRDETDMEEDEMKKVWKNSLIADSKMLFEDMLENFSLEFDDIGIEPRVYEWETMSYVITDRLQRFPNPWETVVFTVEAEKEWEVSKKLNLKVLGITDWRIDKVEVVFS